LRSFGLGCLPLILVLCLTDSRIEATTILRRSLEDMCRISEQIVHGRVVSKQSAYEPGGQIWTTYSIEVDDCLKGAAKSGSPIKQIGGQVGDIRLEAVGVPHFGLGDEILLFARDPGTGWRTVVNGPQGAHSIVTETTRRTGEPVHRRKTIPTASRAMPEWKSIELDSIKGSIRQTLADIEARKGAERK
jgi:hypothetical protein